MSTRRATWCALYCAGLIAAQVHAARPAGSTASGRTEAGFPVEPAGDYFRKSWVLSRGAAGARREAPHAIRRCARVCAGYRHMAVSVFNASHAGGATVIQLDCLCTFGLHALINETAAAEVRGSPGAEGGGGGVA